MRSYLKKLSTTPWTPFVFLIFGDLAMVADVLPRKTSFFLAVLAVSYAFFARRRHALFFTLASVPFAPALPISGFDTFAMWRIIILAFAAREGLRNRSLLKKHLTRRKLKKALFLHEWIGVALFLLAFASLFVAINPLAGMRQIVYFGNAALLYIVLRLILPHDTALRSIAIRALFVALIGTLFLGFAQYAIVLSVSLYEFWQGWALDTIPVFYGESLGQTLSLSNTWFSYYAESPPTLRMFSLLPDSHSFGLLMVLGFLLALGVSLEQNIGELTRSPSTNPDPISSSRGKKSLTSLPWKRAFTLTGFSLAIFFSGSRGIWLSIVPTVLVGAVLLLWTKKLHSTRLSFTFQKRALGAALFILLISFPVASFITSKTHGSGVQNVDEKVALKRAESIFDLEEASNRSRLGIWKTSMKSVLERPILGIGFGNAAAALGESVSAARRGASAHNLYLNTAVETGVLGGILSIVFFLAIIWSAFASLIQKNGSSSPNLSGNGFLTASILAVIWIGTYNLFDIVLINDRALLAFLAFLAVVVSFFRVKPTTERTD